MMKSFEGLENIENEDGIYLRQILLQMTLSLKDERFQDTLFYELAKIWNDEVI